MPSSPTSSPSPRPPPPEPVKGLIVRAIDAARGGRAADAERLCREALALMPRQPDALQLLGTLAFRGGRVAESIELIERAIAEAPDVAEWHYNLATALRAAGRPDDAIASYRRAAVLRPDAAPAHLALATALAEQQRYAEAEESFRRAAALSPASPDAQFGLGRVLLLLNRSVDAVEPLRQTVRLQPRLLDAHLQLGKALLLAGHFSDAVDAHRAAVAVDPASADAHAALAGSLAYAGRANDAVDEYRAALRLKPDHVAAFSSMLLAMHYERHPPAEMLAAHDAFGRQFEPPLASEAAAPHGNDRDPDRRLRVGYISPDFREHSIAYFAQVFLSAHDREQFEVHCFDNNRAATDAMTDALRAHADRWHRIAGLDDAAVARLVREQRIDVLVELCGHFAGNRLLVMARRPAPVQVTYLGYPNTTGLRTIDYWITDALNDPPGQTENYCTEQLVRLPRTFAAYRPPADAPPVSEPPALKNGHVTFGSFNSLTKLNDEVIALWAEVLRDAPTARLLVQTHAMADEVLRRRLIEQFGRFGVGAERLWLRGASAVGAYLNDYADVDVCLDPFPFTGHTISLHTLYMGVPFVTLTGDTHVARRGVNLLTNIGLPELIATDPGDYVRIASALANDVPRLTQLRRDLRDRMRASPLMNEAGFTGELEAAYRTMWRRWCER